MNSNLRGILHWLLYLCTWSALIAVFNSGNVCALENGSFWHITDIHVDQNYSRTGDPHSLCHENSTQKNEDNGQYGNFFCDSPQSLVDITIDAMKKFKPNPDFIVWTGDNLPHTWNPDPSWSTIYEAMKNITNLLRSTFPNITIYPSIGNHDSFPPDTFLPEYKEDNVYTNYLEKAGWGIILPEDAWVTFKKGGYYSQPLHTGLRIISLNTILWYGSNDATANLTDPADQFVWLQQQLQNASDSKEMVYIIGHVSPGFYNRVYPGKVGDPTYHPQYLKRYLDIIEKFNAVIAGQLFGHLHMDTFMLYESEKGVVHSSALLASSVTPWHSSQPDNKGVNLPVNPSVRLMFYDQSDGALMNYEQYFLNLTEANALNHGEGKAVEPQFKLLYNFTEAYGVPNVSTSSLNTIYEKMKSSNEVFQKFFHFLSAGKDSLPCDTGCKKAQLCAIGATSQEMYSACMSTPVGPTPGGNTGGSMTTVYAVVGVVMLVLIGSSIYVIFRLRKRVHRSQSQYQRFPEF